MATSVFGSPIAIIQCSEPRPQTQALIGMCIVRVAARVKWFAEDSNFQNIYIVDNKSNHVSLY